MPKPVAVPSEWAPPKSKQPAAIIPAANSIAASGERALMRPYDADRGRSEYGMALMDPRPRDEPAMDSADSTGKGNLSDLDLPPAIPLTSEQVPWKNLR